MSISTGTNCRACRSSRDDGEAVLARQHHVEHHEIEAAVRGVGQPLERRLAGLDDLDAVALGLEIEAQPLGQVLLVFDDQHALRSSCLAAARGSSSVKVLPCPAPSLSAKARPPCLRGHRSDDEQAEAAALGADGDAGRDAVEAPEDPLQIGRRDADAVIGHAHRDPRRLARRSEPHLDPDVVAGEYFTALSRRFQTAAFSSSPSPTTDRAAAGATSS